LDSWISEAPGPIQPRKGFLCIVAQSVDLRDLVRRKVGILVDQRPKRRIGSIRVRADLQREGERDATARCRPRC
jgi:hypothetical protein